MPGHTELCTLTTWLSEHRDESKTRLLSLKRPEMQGLFYSCSGLQQTLTFRFFPPPQNQGGTTHCLTVLRSSPFRIPDAQDELSINVYIAFRVRFFKSMDIESHAFL